MSKKPKEHEAPPRPEERAEEAKLDEALDESFPASDPSSFSAPGHDTPVGHADKKGERKKR